MKRGWEVTSLIVATIILLSIAGTILWRGRTVGEQIASLSLPLRTSLEAPLEEANSLEEVVVVNWPGAILADRSAYLLGAIPVTPPALFLTAPDIVERDATWVQYPPWQQRVTGLEIEYYGTHVTQAELATLARQAERVVVFNPHIQQMYTLAQNSLGDTSSTCPVSFDERSCLTSVQAVWEDSLLQIELTWKVTGTLSADDTVFVHIVDSQGNLVTQSDGDPVAGLIPLASLREKDETLRETRVVTVPPGDYNIQIGVYNRVSGERLAVHCQSPNTCLKDAVQVTP